MTYTELETAIQDYCQNSETTFVANINHFIKSAEDKAYLLMESKEHWGIDTSESTANGQRTYDTVIALGAIDILDIYIPGLTTLDGVSLQRKDHSFLREAYPISASGGYPQGVPKYYSADSVDLSTGIPRVGFSLWPTPNAIYPMHISYIGKLAASSITNGNTPGGAATDETWLSVVYPTLLVDGSVAEAYRFMKADQPDIDRFEIPFQASLGAMKNFQEVRMRTDISSKMGTSQTNLQTP